MENITLGDIARWLAFIVGILSSIAYLKKTITSAFNKTMDEKLKPIQDRIDEIDTKTSNNNLENIKTSLINLMELADKGAMSLEQNMRAHELYDYYWKHGGNSYVHDKWENLKKEGKI